MTETERLALLAHLAVWFILAAAAMKTAGSYTFASCWHLALFLNLMVAPIYWSIAAASTLFALWLVLFPSARNQRRCFIATHALILWLGPIACIVAAHLSSGRAYCL